MISITKAENARVLKIELLREISPASTIHIHMIAERSIDGCATAIRLKAQRDPMIIIALANLNTEFLTSDLVKKARSKYISPRCKPEMAIICTTPVFE